MAVGFVSAADVLLLRNGSDAGSAQYSKPLSLDTAVNTDAASGIVSGALRTAGMASNVCTCIIAAGLPGGIL